jgi:hypothetical protein
MKSLPPSDETDQPQDAKLQKPPHFTALLCKSLMINGAGEGNRTLVSVTFYISLVIKQLHRLSTR